MKREPKILDERKLKRALKLLEEAISTKEGAVQMALAYVAGYYEGRTKKWAAAFVAEMMNRPEVRARWHSPRPRSRHL